MTQRHAHHGLRSNPYDTAAPRCTCTHTAELPHGARKCFDFTWWARLPAPATQNDKCVLHTLVTQSDDVRWHISPCGMRKASYPTPKRTIHHLKSHQASGVPHPPAQTRLDTPATSTSSTIPHTYRPRHMKHCGIPQTNTKVPGRHFDRTKSAANKLQALDPH